MSDEITIEILEDGTIKADSGKISQVNHQSAEAFMRNLATAGGAKQERKHKHGIVGAAAHALAHAMGKAHGH